MDYIKKNSCIYVGKRVNLKAIKEIPSQPTARFDTQIPTKSIIEDTEETGFDHLLEEFNHK